VKVDERKFDVFVKEHKKRTTEKGTKFSVKLESPKGHYVVLVGESEEIKEGFPIGQIATVKIVETQTSL